MRRNINDFDRSFNKAATRIALLNLVFWLCIIAAIAYAAKWVLS